jgi:hypothetical protein
MREPLHLVQQLRFGIDVPKDVFVQGIARLFVL